MSPDADDALSMYLQGYPDNPSRNRQTLYLLGFKQWTSGGPVPRYTYDWEVNHDQILEEAKEHLRSMVAFGITDCFESSIRFMAPSLGWDADTAIREVSKLHERSGDKQMLVELFDHSKPLPSVMSSFAGKSQNLMRYSWTSLVPPSLAAEIRKRNRVDDELVKYAKQLFAERSGTPCI